MSLSEPFYREFKLTQLWRFVLPATLIKSFCKPSVFSQNLQGLPIAYVHTNHIMMSKF